MASTATAPAPLRKGTKVIATTELRGVPEGTAGKVMTVNGLSWIRYWVRFDNGVALGSIGRDKLATKADLAAQARGELVTEVDGGGDDEGGGGGAAESGGGGVSTPSGTLVPQLLIDRSAAARARLGA